MTLLPSLLAFTAAAALLTVTPGLDTALVLRTAAVEGPRRALLAGLGICLGCLAWGAVVAGGLGALLAASAPAYIVLRYLGAAYLLWLGLRLLTRPRAGMTEDAVPSSGGGRSWLARGFLTNMLNPKVGAFYVSFLPQFIPAGADVPALTLVLSGIHAALGLVWFLLLVAATRPVAAALSRPRLVAALDRMTGAVFLLFAARLALDRR
ncbi:MAG: LysE family translocator [Alphaproteobacteria bacterium]|nr:LysE family translocator [Alphaproteobacteria bacterium]